jgi:hypothetical protein
LITETQNTDKTEEDSPSESDSEEETDGPLPEFTTTQEELEKEHTEEVLQVCLSRGRLPAGNLVN